MYSLPTSVQSRVLLAALLTSAWAGAGCARTEAGPETRDGRSSTQHTGRPPPPLASVERAEDNASESRIEPAMGEATPVSTALGGEPLVALEVPGFEPAVVAVPVSTTRPRPIVLALHGNFDRPEWQCSVWDKVVRERAFVLCPRGIPRRDSPRSADRWEYASARAMKNEIEAAVGALRTRFKDFVADGPRVFLGFSLGAGYGAQLVQGQPDVYPRAVFIEGGVSAWSVSAAKRFVKGGGERLILACGQAGCLTQVNRLGPELTRAGLATEVGGNAHAGHTYDGPVAQAIADKWPWFIEGDARFTP